MSEDERVIGFILILLLAVTGPLSLVIGVDSRLDEPGLRRTR
jgi:hypothetical protein